MRKILAIRIAAMMVAVMTTAATGAAQKATGTSYVNKAAVVRAAVTVFSNSATLGYVPFVSDAQGDLGNSAIFEETTDNNKYVGIGTTTPAFNLNVVSQSDPAAVAVEGYGTVGVNFIGRRAEGTLASPLPLISGDNIMAMQGRGYGATGFSTASRAYMKFFASENWSDAAQGTYITLATTGRGTTVETPRVLIDDQGNVGIGPGLSNPMLSPLTSTLMVNGMIQSTSGGIKFPDNTTQSTAGVVLNSPDYSIAVTGTPAQPQIGVNFYEVQKLVTGTCGAGTAMQSVTPQGAVNCGTIGANGSLANVPTVVANVHFTGGYGVGASQTIYTATAPGFYRVSVYMNVAATGSCSTIPCAGEQISVQWNDGISLSSAAVTANCNLVTVCGSSVVTPVWVNSGQSITAFGQTYGTGNAPSGGTYNAYVLVEQL